MKASYSALTESRNNQKGVALVIVLACLVLLSTLIVAFLTSVTGEYATSKVYAAGASTRFLSDSAVNAVMGQIAQATKGFTTGSNKRSTWASQPGMIRTYIDTGSTGDAYKLYSSPKMVIPAGTPVNQEMTNDVPNGWESKPAFYTDLNAPVTDANQNVRFPIIDGNVKAITVAGKRVLTYDANGDGVPDIEGFGIDPAFVPKYQAGKPLSPDNNPVTMPAQWIYVLKDGTLISPDSGGTDVAKFSGTNAPTKDNPITGRIAFWTDDESSKLNINTASEGSFYTFPRTNSQLDMVGKSGKPGYAISPPANGEFNRYPGHPATTCLSVALGYWVDNGIWNPPSAYTSSGNDTKYLQALDKYMKLSPRVALGGSKAGTIDANTPAYTPVTPTATDPMNDRLYCSLDELMFKPNRTDSLPGLDNNGLERLRFFMTASSRAAEVTPFNTPKVSMWPQWMTLADRTARRQPSEQLLAFCSSIGSDPASVSKQNEFFFQRYGGNSGYSCLLDWDKVPRNQALANYLYRMGSEAIPGYGGKFVTKYPSFTLSSIIIESLDLIRSNVAKEQYIQGEGYIWPLVVKNNMPGVTAGAPIKGMGDYPVFTQVALGVGNSGGNPVAFLIFDTFAPVQTMPGRNMTLRLKMENAENLGIRTAAGKPPIASTQNIAIWDWKNNKTQTMRGYGWTLRATNGSYMSFDNSLPITSIGTGRPVTFSVLDGDKGDVLQKFTVAFPATQVPTPIPGQNMGTPWYDFGSGPVTSMSSLTNELACSVRGMECGSKAKIAGDWRILASIWNADTTGGVPYFHTTKNYNNSAMRQAHMLRLCDWWDSHSKEPTFGNGTSWPNTTSVCGSLVKVLTNLQYADHQAPYTPEGLQAAINADGRPGDWDTGPGIQPDGPFANPTAPTFISGVPIYFEPDTLGGQPGGVQFCPNRQVASAIKFGSLPTGVDPTNPRPWQTLLFCPNPASRTTPAGSPPTDLDHIGFKNPPDHTYLEFFTMPTVEPYAISEPLSTAGKVNINFQMAPFTSIERSTAVRGVLKNVLMSGITANSAKPQSTNHPTSDEMGLYKWSGRYGNAYETRYDINRDATLDGVKAMFFNKGNIFRYASEVCDVFLVPQKIQAANYHSSAANPPASYTGMVDWWNRSNSLTTMNLTGDNLREEPYDRIYPRLTTKSNTYTVHYRVQVLKKRPNSAPAEWNEGIDQIVAESRGSTMIERYIDPSNPLLDTKWDSDTRQLVAGGKADLSQYYKFRVISSKKFAP